MRKKCGVEIVGKLLHGSWFKMTSGRDLSDDSITEGVGQNCKGCGKLLKLYDVICVVEGGYAHLPCTVHVVKKSLRMNFGDSPG